MLPTILSHELMEGINAFLRSTFPTSTPAFKGALDEILEGTGRNKLFQGPYLRVGLPFKPGSTGQNFFPRLETTYPPYVHQEEAWKRIRTEVGKSTLVATGTGSGKTECFTYPILDHILANPSERGIKAIILYPMNALATDQARRFAREIHSNSKLNGKVRVGLYVGGLADGGGSKSMSETEVITNRDELRASPPDVLLTNYKMLDYLLVRQKDSSLWAQNTIETLRYLVVDELHTFDGAQGTDLACLIRRLKARLKTPADHLCCIGTSATLGGPNNTKAMVDFAGLIFGESFAEQPIINETRKKASEHIESNDEGELEILYFEPPSPENHQKLLPANYDSILDYVETQSELWFGKRQSLSTLEGRVTLAGLLRRHNFLRTFLSYFKEGVLEEDAILSDLKKRRSLWTFEHHKLLINSFVSLCAIARDAPLEGAYFLQIRSELWMRELARIVASVSPQPAIRFSMDLPAEHPQKHLAAMHCRECGVMGWGALQKTNEEKLIPDIDRFYQAFFSYNPDPRLRFIFPADERRSRTTSLHEQHLCGSCLSIFESQDGKCPECGTTREEDDQKKDQSEGLQGVSTFRIDSKVRTITRTNLRIADKSCPYCDSSTGLTIVGSRAASLTSVGLSQLFGSPFNNDKKAMAFSDSVQDASHRAGFFSARTYQIAVRTALCKVITQSPKNTSLASLAPAFPDYWLKAQTKEEFVGTFMPPNFEWMAEFEEYRNSHSLPKSSNLPAKVRNRMEWEVIREFGIQSRIGRTLEKSGSAATFISPDTVSEGANALLKEIQMMSSAFSGFSELDVTRLIFGVSERLRSNGGIAHPFIESYIEQEGDEYVFNKGLKIKPRGEFLPPISQQGRGRRPMFFANYKSRETFEPLIGLGTSLTWMQHWVTKWLENLIGDGTQNLSLTPIIEALSNTLTEINLWKKYSISKKDHKYAWALNPENLFVSAKTVNHACQKCGHQVTTASVVAETWESIPCLRHKCPGSYQGNPKPEASYFGNLYKKGDITRLRASEHTSMLDRLERENIETEFMRTPSLSTDTNLLSCTPTLEMGVDVGDLSTVLLCSVPPEQSNYIQRVGRGGRKDGNSLALTVATADSHNLQHYEEPLEMLAGDVQLPAIFLRAPAVLERQLTAYCIDRWIESDPAAEIPAEMAAVYLYLSKVQQGEKQRNAAVFPSSFYQFIDTDTQGLIDGFTKMFNQGELDEKSLINLDAFIKGNDESQGSLSFKLNKKLAAAFKDREALFKKRISLRKAKKNNENISARDEKVDSELHSIKAEIQGISRLIRELEKKQTLNFLSDEGLIPNYAFPEEGVTLRSIILKKPDLNRVDSNEDNSKTIKLEFEHMRPAEAAITELAPGNSFYVAGRKLTVDQVSIEQDDYEEWHFCKSCSHLEPVSTKSESYTACPRCHCGGWSDTSLHQKMLKMRQVFVTAWDKSVRNLDQKDQRDLTVFNKQTSIHYEKEAIRKSYSLKAEGASFAFDFIDQVTLRETNFGEDQFDGDSVQIGGKTLRGVGFKVCNSCGKIQSRRANDKPKHDISCKLYGKDLKGEEYENTFLLYRQLNSEAIKLLIPSLNQDENIDTQSFVAAINLGLKEKFGGHLSHLKLSVQQQPIGDGTLRSQHVFIYDNVPGGTGYLKDLTKDQTTFMKVLEIAHVKLQNCSCAEDPELDGCYKCIKAYRFRFVNNEISRSTALHQLKKILDNRESIEERSADEALINPLLESELERRFIESLRKEDEFTVNQEVVDGRPGYLLRTSQAAWKIIPQVDLGMEQGVSRPCRPDFILKPLRSSRGLPIAIFLDGFAYHADNELNNNRIADDIAKRNAIRMSGNYLVWSLTWADLQGDLPADNTFLSKAFNGLGQLIKNQCPALAELNIYNSPSWNSWDLLLKYIVNSSDNDSSPLHLSWQKASTFLSCNFVNRAPVDGKNLRLSLENLVRGDSPKITPTSKQDFMCSWQDQDGLRLITAIPASSFQNKTLEGAFCSLWFDDTGNKPSVEFQAEWQELLRSFNILQFVPRFCAFTKNMMTSGGISGLMEWLLEPEPEPEPEPEEPSSPKDKHALSDEHLEELELLEPSLQPILIPLLKESKIPWPEFGFEATSAAGTCSESFLEVAWPEIKVGIALPSDDTGQFKKDGWAILDSESLNQEELKSALG